MMNIAHAIARNGTQQQERLAEQLSADFVSIEERSVEQQLTFMQQLAQHIRFFDLDGKEQGNWSGLFEIDATTMQAYMDDPDSYLPDPDGSVAEQREQLDYFNRLSRPQQVMVYIFVRMTQAIRSRFDELTEQHRNFYYQQVLQLSPDKGKADQVHLLFSLAQSAQGTTLTEGTLVAAGTDGNGQPIQFALDDTFEVNQAKIGDIKGLRVNREYVPLYQMRQKYNNGFEVVLRWALGQYFQGDLLPAYPLGRYFDQAVDLAFLQEKYSLYHSADAPAIGSDEQKTYQNYIEVVLGFASVAEFDEAMAVYTQSIDPAQAYPTQAQWINACDKVENAFNLRWRARQMQELVAVYRPATATDLGRLQSLFEHIFGEPLAGDRLPAMPATTDTLESLYQLLGDPSKRHEDRYKLAARYVAGLGINVSDFLFIYQMHLQSNALYLMKDRDVLAPEQPAATSWYRFFGKLQRLQAKKRGLNAPKVGRQDVRNILPKDTVALTGGEKVFGEVDNYQDVENYYGPGLAIASELLHMAEGERHIRLEVACKQSGFPMDDLKLAQQNGKLHFDVSLSGETGWQKLNSQSHAEALSYEISNIGDELIAAYTPEKLDVVVNVATLPGGENIRYDDFLILRDGSMWQVVGFGETSSQVRLRYLNLINNISDNQNLHLPSLAFAQNPTPLNTLSYAPSKQEVSLTAQDEGFGSTPEVIEQGDYILLASGEVLLVTRLVDEGAVGKVQLLGHLPESVKNTLNSGIDEAVHHRLTSLAFRQQNVLAAVEFQSLKGNETTGSDIVFNSADLDRLVRFPNGYGFKLRYLVEPLDDTDPEEPTKAYRQALVELLPSNTISYTNLRIEKFSTYPGFVFDIKLDSTMPSVGAPPQSEQVAGLSSKEPVVKLQLASYVDNIDSDGAVDIAFEYFNDVQLHSVKVMVDVKGLRELKLANDSETLIAGKPFEPFTAAPYVGAALYFTHYELARKKLSMLKTNLEWVDLPENFSEHYQAYEDAYPLEVPNITSSSFKVGMSLFNQRGWIDLNQGRLLFNTDANDTSHIVFEQGLNHSSYDFLPEISEDAQGSASEQKRYFKLALKGPDFQHKMYTHVMRKSSLDAAQNPGQTPALVKEPYTPKVKTFSVDYQAQQLITPDKVDSYTQLGHLHPFGAINLNHLVDPERPSKGPSLLPQFKDEGYLYIGLTNAQLGGQLNLHIQVMTGTGAANLNTPVLHWYYRSATGMKPLPAQNLLDDTTRSMTFSGLVRLRLPDDATTTGPILPEGMHWLAVQVRDNADAAAKIVAVNTQALSATRVGVIPPGDPAALPPQSVSGLVEPNSDIAAISQPYPSIDGKAQADADNFVRDTAERLRHRNRAVNLWDYERLVLRHFGQLWQVKCLAHGELEDAGRALVDLVVLPQMAGLPLEQVLKPAVSPDLLEKVRLEMAQYMPPEVELRVKNPDYHELKFRVAVKFNPGFGPGIYRPLVIEQIKRLLAPWAQGDSKGLNFGNRLYFSQIIDHLERLPYIDYIAVLTGFEQQTAYAGTDAETEVWQPIAQKYVEVARPDSLLVSHIEHTVDVISSEHFNAEDYMGVGYMIVELDNVVS